MINLDVICQRIGLYIHRTPIMSSSELNKRLGHRIYFKMEPFQKTGSFKVRGALNTVLKLKEESLLPQDIIAFSSGNHAQAIAYAASIIGASSHICMEEFCSTSKVQATRSYGADVILSENRMVSQQKAKELVERCGGVFIHPYDNDNIIEGQATVCYEALQELPNIDAVFAPCGGGGLLSGTYLAREYTGSTCQIFGVEPEQANDAYRSYYSGSICQFDETPQTIADGARTLSISERTFTHLKNLDGFFMVSEDDIVHWMRQVYQYLKVTIEPTSAVALAGATQWMSTQITPKDILVIVSGGNVSPSTMCRVFGTEN